ncbi:SDR family oxidoreductase [Amycolatopsis sp. PS_44_ISF1]|uniref:SDR family oxidoreductase n=1 Tax=Amycolatopsis sp. PS_44_ISF1 TaxID=2974917 RepID=UPI0028DE59D5|nr:SDR family oxidoreductase [Amycolatopsis sp. PS_44_ISF1]MDT8913010.1 SDR family oxidoreductase [Amycolatopsis sp. PS_44_ISF1]
MTVSITGKKLLIVGGSSGIARQLAEDASGQGASVVLAGRRPVDVPGVTAARVDLADESSIRELAAEVGPLDYLVSLAADHANGPVGELDRDAVHRAFDAKVVGPILLAKHLAPQLREGGAILLFSGVAAWRPSPGLAVMATTNGAVSFLARALAVELAPIRVNALSPGIVDSGSWDRMGADRDGFFEEVATGNPARRVGRPEDIASAALLALTNPFLTGTTLHVDGGGRIA